MAIKQTPDALYKAYRSEPGLRPVAQPVDTFVKSYADPSAGSELTQLAQALEGLQPQLNQYFDKKREEATEAELAEGRKAYETNKLQWQEYLKQHPEHRGFSPHFQKGYRGMYLREQARKYVAELNDAYNKGATIDIDGKQVDVRTIEDASGFENWKASFTRDWYSTHLSDIAPTEFNESFLPIAEEGGASLTSSHVRQRAAAYDAAYQDKFSNEIMEYATGLTDLPEFDTAEGRLQSLQQIGTFITEKTNTAITEGLLPQEANNLAVDAIIKAAGAVGGEEGMQLLESLQHAKAGTGVLGKIGKYAVALDGAKEKIADDYMNLELKKIQYEKAIKLQQTSEIMDKVFPQMWDNPQADWTPIISQLSKEHGWQIGDELKDTLSSIRTSRGLDSSGRAKHTGGSESNPQALANLYTIEMMADSGQLSVAEANKHINTIIASGVLSNTDMKHAFKLKTALNKGEITAVTKESNKQIAMLKPAYIPRDSAAPETIAHFNRLSGLIKHNIAKISTQYPEGSPEFEDAVNKSIEGLMKKYPPFETEKMPPLVSKLPVVAPMAKYSILSASSPKVDAKKINYTNQRLFVKSDDFMYYTKTWARNPLDPGNPINKVAKKLGITPKELLVRQAPFYTFEDIDASGMDFINDLFSD